MTGLVLDQWISAFAPAGTSAAITARLNAEINKVLTDPPVRAYLEEQALEGVGGTAEAADRLLRDDVEKYGRLFRELNIQTQ